MSCLKITLSLLRLKPFPMPDDAAAKTKEVFSWERKKADKLFLAVHGNTQNGQTARNDWETLLGGNSQWQIETIQSAEPDGYGTYRWSYDMVSYQSVARALKRIQSEGYGQNSLRRLFSGVRYAAAHGRFSRPRDAIG